MTRKKKVMMIVFSILGAVIIALSAVLTAAAIMGRPLKVNPSRKLDGVEGDIQNALWYSSIAANSHNTQMWSVKLYPNENRLQISIDESRVLKKQLNNCGAFAVITGGSTFEELINTGRKTQAFWFDCTENNIAVQPFSAALETEPFCSSIQTDLGVAAPVQMILRLGYVDEYGANCGLRRNLSDYIEVL